VHFGTVPNHKNKKTHFEHDVDVRSKRVAFPELVFLTAFILINAVKKTVCLPVWSSFGQLCGLPGMVNDWYQQKMSTIFFCALLGPFPPRGGF
jgi:hypothetical protein